MNLSKNNQATWLWDIAEEDVYMLSGCHAQPMFDKLKDMILSSWTCDGEQGLADTFQKSYLDNDLFNKWRYNVSGIPECIPQNNSHERSYLDSKGCAAFCGITTAREKMMAMFKNELPSLIFFNSIERTRMERKFTILN
jgi:hypothetical protein